jgi:GNAT superfamily N-acetyltransferase
MQIDYLANHPQFIPELARWHHEEWSYLRPGDTVEARIARLREACARRPMPAAFVAFTDLELLGSAALVNNDMDTRPNLSPWLAGVFVAPAHRRGGIGAALVGRVVLEARALGHRRIYLYTPSAEGFYSKLGWSLFDHALYRGVNVTVMSFDYENPAPVEGLKPPS